MRFLPPKINSLTRYEVIFQTCFHNSKINYGIFYGVIMGQKHHVVVLKEIWQTSSNLLAMKMSNIFIIEAVYIYIDFDENQFEWDI